MEGSAVILISDGEENIPPYVHEVKQTLVDSRVVINTIAFGKLASTQLEGLVTSTGGRGFFYEGEVKTDFPTHANGLESALFASTTTQADVDFHPVEAGFRQSNQAEMIPFLISQILTSIFIWSRLLTSWQSSTQGRQLKATLMLTRNFERT